MRKQGEESTAAESARRATGAAAERDRRGRFSARCKRATVLRLAARRGSESVSREWGSRRRGPRNGVIPGRGSGGAEEPRPLRRTSGCTPRSAAAHGERALYVPPGGRRPFGSAENAMSGADLRPSGVRRTTGLPRVGTGAVQRLRATTRRGRAPHGAAGRSVPPRTRCWSATSAECSKPHRFMAKGTGKRGRSCGSKGSHLAERVRRLMREHGLQAPARVTPARRHIGQPPTCGHDVHGDADLSSWPSITVHRVHPGKRGTRFEALEPIRQGVRERFGPISDGVARGLRLRHDHGSNYLADDFQQEVAFFGIESSPSFVREPEAMGSRSVSSAR